MSNYTIKHILFFVAGAYCGTYYDFKPYFKEATDFIIKNIPKER